MEKFALNLSDHVGVEIKGAYFSEGGSKNAHITMGGYDGNNYRASFRSGLLLGLKNNLTLTAFFHTHPTASGGHSERQKGGEED